MERELTGILHHIERIQALDLDDVPPTTHVVPVANVVREDVPRSLPVEEALREAPEVRQGGFAVGGSSSAESCELTAEGAIAAVHAGEVGVSETSSTRTSPARRTTAGRVPRRRRGAARGPAPARSTPCPSARRSPASPSRSRTRSPRATSSRPRGRASWRASGRSSPRPASAPRGGRRRRRGEDEHGRVRDGLEHRELRVPAHPQPLGPRARAGRLERRLGRGRGRVPGAVVARLRHRRLDPPAGGALRHRRA